MKKIICSAVLLLSSFLSFGQNKSLKESYKNTFKVGVAVNPEIVSGIDKQSQAIVKEHFNAITVENVMKAALINPEPGVYNFGPADEYVQFGKANNMFIIGHTLVWHNQTPEWFFKDEKGNLHAKEAVKQRLHDHIKLVAGRYAGKVNA